MALPSDMSPAQWAEARARSAEVSAAWRALPAMRALAATLDDEAGDASAAMERAIALFADIDWVAALLAPLVEGLTADPFFDPPFRVNRDRARVGAVLFDSSAARVSATIVSARALLSPGSVVMPGHVSVTRYVRTGGATIRRWRADMPDGDFDAREATPAVELAPVMPRDGEIIVQDGRVEGQVVAGATRDIVLLTATLRRDCAPLIREYATADGRLLRASTIDEFASRGAMLLSLLRIQRRPDAARVFATATRDRAFHVRWSAMREWLALDARAALPRLAEMAAADPNHEVRGAAAATLAMARERMESVRCLA